MENAAPLRPPGGWELSLFCKRPLGPGAFGRRAESLSSAVADVGTTLSKRGRCHGWRLEVRCRR